MTADSPPSYTFTAVGQCACVTLSNYDPTSAASLFFLMAVDIPAGGPGTTTTTLPPGSSTQALSQKDLKKTKTCISPFFNFPAALNTFTYIPDVDGSFDVHFFPPYCVSCCSLLTSPAYLSLRSPMMTVTVVAAGERANRQDHLIAIFLFLANFIFLFLSACCFWQPGPWVSMRNTASCRNWPFWQTAFSHSNNADRVELAQYCNPELPPASVTMTSGIGFPAQVSVALNMLRKNNGASKLVSPPHPDSAPDQQW